MTVEQLHPLVAYNRWLLLRQLGHEPPCTDYRDFLTEARDEKQSATGL